LCDGPTSKTHNTPEPRPGGSNKQMMVIEEKLDVIKFCESSETELTGIWEIEAEHNSILWSRRDHKLEKKNEKRNLKIEIIRENFLNKTKNRWHNYESRGDYPYKSKEHQRQFLEIIQAAGLEREPELEIGRVPYDIDGFSHTVSIPKWKPTAKHCPTKFELSVIENRNMSELGSIEGLEL
jgi:hypothetical protein